MSFRRFFLVRLGWALIGLWLAVTIVFVITRVVVSPNELCKYTRDRGSCRDALVEQLDLDDPVYARYLHFVWRLAAHQSPGSSPFIGGADSGHVARHALPATAALVAAALLLGLALAAAAAIGWSRLAARWDRLLRLPIYLAVGLSPIFLGLLLSYYLGFKWEVTPISGYCDLFNPPAEFGCGGARDWLSHLVLPVVTLSLFFAAIYTRILHAGIADIRAVRDASKRRKLSRRFILVVARVAGRDFGWVIGVAYLVESNFSIPGLGQTAAASVSYGDLGTIEAVLVYAAFLAIAVHCLVDVIVGALDSDLRAEWPVAGMPKPT